MERSIKPQTRQSSKQTSQVVEVERWEFDSLSDTESSHGTISSSSSTDSDGPSLVEEKLDRLELDSLSDETSDSEDGLENSFGKSSSPSLLERDYLESAGSESERGKDEAEDGRPGCSSANLEPRDEQPAALPEVVKPRTPATGLSPLSEAVEATEVSQEAGISAQGSEAEQTLEADDLPQLEPIVNLPSSQRSPEGNSQSLLENDDPIWRRTRARNPLTGVTIEELEGLLEDEAVDSDLEDEQAYFEFLTAFQSGATAETSLLPEEDDDGDFMLDLDDLLAAGEDAFQPSSPRSPLQTRHGRVIGNALPAAQPPELPWVPQNIPSEAGLQQTPPSQPGSGQPGLSSSLTNRSRPESSHHPHLRHQPAATATGYAAPRRRKRRREQPPSPPAARDEGHAALLDAPAAEPPDGRGISYELQNFAKAQADSIREHIELRRDYLEWKRAERRTSQARKQRKILKQADKNPAGSEESSRRKRRPPAETLRGTRRSKRLAPPAAEGDEEAEPEAANKKTQGKEISAAEMQPVVSQADAQRRRRKALGRTPTHSKLPVHGWKPPLAAEVSAPAEAEAQPDAASLDDAAAAAAEHDGSGALAEKDDTSMTHPSPAHHTEPQLVIEEAEAPRVVSFSLPQLGLVRRQVGQHLQLLCHTLSLLKSSRGDGIFEAAEQSRLLLQQFLEFSTQIIGLSELQSRPFLPPAVTQPLDQSCPKAPLQGPVRCLLAVPILPRLSAFLASVAALPQGGQTTTASPESAAQETTLHPGLQLPLQEIAPFMAERLIPRLAIGKAPRPWLPAESQLLRFGMLRFGHQLEEIQKYYLPTKTIDSIRQHIKVEEDKMCPMQKRSAILPPLTQDELNVIRAVIRERNGQGPIWDILAETKLLHRRAQDLQHLYWKQAYQAGRTWANIKDEAAAAAAPKPAPSRRQRSKKQQASPETRHQNVQSKGTVTVRSQASPGGISQQQRQSIPALDERLREAAVHGPGFHQQQPRFPLVQPAPISTSARQPPPGLVPRPLSPGSISHQTMPAQPLGSHPSRRPQGELPGLPDPSSARSWRSPDSQQSNPAAALSRPSQGCWPEDQPGAWPLFGSRAGGQAAAGQVLEAFGALRAVGAGEGSARDRSARAADTTMGSSAHSSKSRSAELRARLLASLDFQSSNDDE